MKESVPLRILIVDDDADAAWSLAALLRSALDCEARTALGGADAIEEASSRRFDAIVIDIAMPRIDGMEVAAILRRLYRDDERPRLIALTGLDFRHWPGQLVEDAFDRCLQKPLDLEALLRALHD